jgi:hypothetical protein
MASSVSAQNLDPNTFYRIVAKHNGKVLFVDTSVNSGLDNQANVGITDWNGGNNQQWKIEALGDGYCRLMARHSGRMLDVNLGMDNQANVVQHEWHGGDNQRWKIEPLGDGYYRLIAKHSGRMLDANLDLMPGKNYANVVQHEWHGGDNQRWRIEAVTGATGGNSGDPGRVDLTGLWSDDNGSSYWVRQVGNKLYWRMENLPEVANVFAGTISGASISGEWADIPGGRLQNSGTLQLRIVSNNRLEKVSSSFHYGGSIWTRK